MHGSVYYMYMGVCECGVNEEKLLIRKLVVTFPVPLMGGRAVMLAGETTLIASVRSRDGKGNIPPSFVFNNLLT